MAVMGKTMGLDGARCNNNNKNHAVGEARRIGGKGGKGGRAKDEDGAVNGGRGRRLGRSRQDGKCE